MAITTADALIAGFASGQRLSIIKASAVSVAGGYVSLINMGGTPGAGTTSLAGATGVGVVCDSTLAGALPFTNPGGGGNTYIGRMAATSGSIGTFVVYDRLWHAGPFTPANGAMNSSTSTALTRPDALGQNVELWAEVNVVVSGALNLTVTYDVSNVVTGHTATCAVALPAGRMTPFVMAAGDTGVKQITALSGDAVRTGSVNLVLLRRIAELPINIASAGLSLDIAELCMPRVYDSACLCTMMQTNTTSSGQMTGSITLIQG